MLREIRDLVVNQEPMVEEASLDNPLNPQALLIELGVSENDALSRNSQISE